MFINRSTPDLLVTMRTLCTGTRQVRKSPSLAGSIFQQANQALQATLVCSMLKAPMPNKLNDSRCHLLAKVHTNPRNRKQISYTFTDPRQILN